MDQSLQCLVFENGWSKKVIGTKFVVFDQVKMLLYSIAWSIFINNTFLCFKPFPIGR